LALFNKEANRSIENKAAPKLSTEQQVLPMPVTQSVAPNLAREEKPTMPVPSPSIEPRSNAEGRAYLDSGSTISGKLFFEGATRIDGKVDGEITATESLMIGETAVVTAQIKANSIIIAGKANGDIMATRRLEIRPSARVSGNLTSPVVIVHEGATFEGHCSMQPEGTHEDRKAAPSPKEERLTQVAQKAASPDFKPSV
jgi:cytoskeletal protein CcmA (bactofilin family)